MLDKELYRDALSQYRRWSEQKALARAEIESKLSPAQAWARYAALWELVVKLSPEETEQQAKQKERDLRDYYARMRKFERRKNARLKAARKTTSTSR